MGVLKKLMPTRQDHDVKIVADLDRMIAEPFAIRVLGRVHYIKPMTTEVFLKVAEGIARLDAFRGAKKINENELLKAYAFLFEQCCDTIGIKEVKKMTESQIGGFYQQVIECVTGRAHANDEQKKKNVNIQ